MFERFGAGGLGIKNDGKGKFDFLTFYEREAATFQANGIEPGELIHLVNNTVGWDVAGHTRISLRHGEVANVDELVDAGASAEEDF